MKKGWLLFLTLGLSNLASASGFYLSGALGGAKTDMTLQKTTPEVSMDSTDIAFGFAAGFQYDFQRYPLFVAGEFEAIFGKAEAEKRVDSLKVDAIWIDGIKEPNATGTNVKLKASRSTILGAHFLPGIYLRDDISIYGRFGLMRTKVEAKFDAIVDSKNSSGTASKSDNGFTFGAGARYSFDTTLAVYAEYRYVKYDTFTFTDLDADIELKEHIFSIGLHHEF